MKSLKIILAALFISACAQAQDSLLAKRRKHEIGVDLTLFLKNYLNFSQNDYSVRQNQTYYIHYRFHLRSGNNIRAGLGGGYYETETPSQFQDDPTKYKNKQQSINYRLGFEHFENISSRFQVFYGIDLFSSDTYQKNDAPYWNGGYANGVENKSMTYGLSPMLGIRYKINKRLSVFTESSFLISQTQGWQRKYYIPVSSAYPAMGASAKANTRSVGTSFNYPLFIVLAIDL